MRWTILLLPLASCSVDSPESDHTAFATCEEIAVACHNVDVAEDGGIGEDCHVVAHVAKLEATCVREKEVCLAYCSPDGGFDANAYVDSGSRILDNFLDASREAGDASDASNGGDQ